MVTVYALSTAGWVIVAIAFLAIWIALAFWPARVARRKGHSFLVFFPLPRIVAYMVQDRTVTA
jgi:hypothetical protein